MSFEKITFFDSIQWIPIMQFDLKCDTFTCTSVWDTRPLFIKSCHMKRSDECSISTKSRTNFVKQRWWNFLHTYSGCIPVSRNFDFNCGWSALKGFSAGKHSTMEIKRPRALSVNCTSRGSVGNENYGHFLSDLSFKFDFIFHCSQCAVRNHAIFLCW